MTLSVQDPYRELAAWLDGRSWASCSPAVIESLDLRTYLRETSHIDLPATERLRQLAIVLEPGMSACDQPRGWLAIERIYAAGRAIDPTDAEIELSRAITADRCASITTDRPEVQRRILLAGRDAAGRALALRPDDPATHCVLGMLEYSFRVGSIESALVCFEHAIALDPSFGWARLYLAHCLQDLERWAEAAQAYDQVPPAFLVGDNAWRYDLLREQRAWCLLQAGNRERAVAEFLGVLRLYELQPDLAKYQMLHELTMAAEGLLKAELSDRFARLQSTVDHGWAPSRPEKE